MFIDLSQLNYNFSHKPLLIGGMAMEYYGLRKAGNDVDFVVAQDDYQKLSQKYPQQTKDLYGDLGVVIDQFELWTSICLFNYQRLLPGAIEHESYLVVSLDKLLLLKSLGTEIEKYASDVRLIGEKLKALQYGKDFRPMDKG